MRIQLDIPSTMEGRIKQWMKDTGFRTYSELFNNSMSLFAWVGNEVRNGRVILSADPARQEPDKQLSMPFMDALAADAANTRELTSVKAG
jgi:hypothetical protein